MLPVCLLADKLGSGSGHVPSYMIDQEARSIYGTADYREVFLIFLMLGRLKKEKSRSDHQFWIDALQYRYKPVKKISTHTQYQKSGIPNLNKKSIYEVKYQCWMRKPDFYLMFQ